MKPLAPWLLALACLLAGCSTTTPAAGKATAKADAPPEVGLTRDQVVARFGETKYQRVSSTGETWIYNLSQGEPVVPWNVGYQPRLRIIDFDKNGKVKRLTYSR